MVKTEKALKKAVVNFVKPLPGFEQHFEYEFEEYKSDSPFIWMTSTLDRTLRFIAINVFDFFPGYILELSIDDMALIGGSNENLIVLGLITIPEKLSDMTVNLAAPIVINPKTLTGGQFVNQKRYDLREKLLVAGDKNVDTVKEDRRKDNNKR
jgi:flagellar assembly factor FliW